MLRSLRKVASGFLAGLMLLSASAMAENVPNDVPLQQIAAEAGADNYYQEAIETEIYNYSLFAICPQPLRRTHGKPIARWPMG